MIMDDAALQRLMMDDALGALEPDTRALLAEFLNDRRGPKADYAQWQRLIAAASQAIPASGPETLPEFPLRRLQWSRFQRAARLTLSAAAMVLIGVGVGLRVSKSSNSTKVAINSPSPQSANLPHPAPAPSDAAATFGVPDFWSTQRLLASALSANRQPRTQWQWIDSYSALHSGGPR
jgi:anti-sigma factor RsiW